MVRAAGVIRSAIGLGLVAIAGADGGGVIAQDARSAAECPDRLGENAALLCSCPAAAATAGQVWGSQVYTDDSNICRAAVHAGAIDADGGLVSVVADHGRQAYAGSLRHGVASENWGRWQRSIIFRPVGNTANTAADEPDFAPGDGGPQSCPDTAGGIDVAMRCVCDSVAVAGTQAIWGSNPYTTDSAICRAARHAGVIGRRGGPVTVRILPGRSSYRGSTRHGVATSNWGSYGSSFTVER